MMAMVRRKEVFWEPHAAKAGLSSVQPEKLAGWLLPHKMIIDLGFPSVNPASLMFSAQDRSMSNAISRSSSVMVSGFFQTMANFDSAER
jgi:hypothetical protein